ncbi:MAG: hypothetical protein TECD_01129 [Hyphomicrobiaceae bacterium hypho_1]
MQWLELCNHDKALLKRLRYQVANFGTHISAGFVVIGAIATITLAADVISKECLLTITTAGVVGSILPDIDHKESRSSQAFFSALALVISFSVLTLNIDEYSVVEIWLLWLFSFILVRYAAATLFHLFSYHRGVWHSLLAAFFFWFIATNIFYYFINYDEVVAWCSGGFVFIGYLTHLILDELFSVDLMGRRLKASFGSALKLYDYRNISDSLIVGVFTFLAFLLTPSPESFINQIKSQQLWLDLKIKLLPKGEWFSLYPSHFESQQLMSLLF